MVVIHRRNRFRNEFFGDPRPIPPTFWTTRDLFPLPKHHLRPIPPTTCDLFPLLFGLTRDLFPLPYGTINQVIHRVGTMGQELDNGKVFASIRRRLAAFCSAANSRDGKRV